MHMKEAASSVESIRKALQDFLAPELRGLAVPLEAIDKRLDDIHSTLTGVRDQLGGDIKNVSDQLGGDSNSVRGELHAVEARMKEAIDQAKCEILLTVQLADSEQRNAVLQRKVNELEQKPPQ